MAGKRKQKLETIGIRPAPAIDPLIDWSRAHALVIGLGESGLAAVRWLVRQGAQVTVIDTRPVPPSKSDFEGLFAGHDRVHCMTGLSAPLESSWLAGITMVIPGPGLSPRPVHQGPIVELLLEAGRKEIPVYGEIDLFEWAIHHAAYASAGNEPSPDFEFPFELPKVLAITGTNGKTTTTQMTAALLRRAGWDVQEAGNISPSLLDAVMLREDRHAFPQVWVLELSSFQLAIAQHFHPTAAALLNISEDHLDWHTDFEDYVAAKRRVFGFGADEPMTGVRCVVNRQEAVGVQDVSDASDQCSFGMDVPVLPGDFGLIEEGISWICMRDRLDPERLHRLMPADALRVRGRHNTMNALAALALCQAVSPALAPLLHGLREFQGGAHRVQWIAEVSEVHFIDDSKGTNVGATVAALEGLGMRLVLIAGGEGKGQNFAPLEGPIARHARAVVTLGRDGPAIAQAARAAGVTQITADSMEEAVQKAFQAAAPGDAVLLSPACASFDMFDDYRHRAEVFAAAVRNLALAQGVAC